MGDLESTCRAWLATRPPGCPARRAVERSLARLSGPPRVAVTSPVAALEVPVCGATVVHAAWPLTQPGIDVGVLVTERVTGRMRARMQVGPFPIVVCASIADVQQAIDAVNLPRAREQALAREVTHTARQYPHANVPATHLPRPREERAWARGTSVGVRVCVVGHGRVDLPGFDVVAGPDKGADVCVAVAGPNGWEAGDREILAECFAAIGRLVVTAPPPPGLDDWVVVARHGLPEAIAQACQRPPAVPLPPVPVSRVATARFRRRTLWEPIIVSVIVAVGLSRMLPVAVAAALAGVLYGVRRSRRQAKSPGRAWAENLVQG